MNKPIDEMVQKIVIERLLAMPENVGVSIGMEGNFSKDELMEHVKKGDDVGKKMMAVQFSYLQSLKNLTNRLIE